MFSLKIFCPMIGIPHEKLLSEMKIIKEKDENPDNGKMFALVYTSSNDVFQLQTKAYDMFCGKYTN